MRKGVGVVEGVLLLTRKNVGMNNERGGFVREVSSRNCLGRSMYRSIEFWLGREGAGMGGGEKLGYTGYCTSFFFRVCFVVMRWLRALLFSYLVCRGRSSRLRVFACSHCREFPPSSRYDCGPTVFNSHDSPLHAWFHELPLYEYSTAFDVSCVRLDA